MIDIKKFSIFLPLAVFSSTITNINSISFAENKASFKNFNKLEIFKYLYISDNDLINIWTDDIFRKRVLNNPNILFSDLDNSITLKAYNFADSNKKNFVIPFWIIIKI